MAKVFKLSGLNLKRLILWGVCITLVGVLTFFLIMSTHNALTPAKTTTTAKQVGAAKEPSNTSTAGTPTFTPKTQDNGASTATQASSIGIVFSVANQDFNGGPVNIKTILSGVDGGTCTVTLTKEAITITKFANIILKSTFYGCDGFTIPYTELSPGSWNLNLMVSQNDKSNSFSKTVNVQAGP